MIIVCLVQVLVRIVGLRSAEDCVYCCAGFVFLEEEEDWRVWGDYVEDEIASASSAWTWKLVRMS